MGLHIPGTVSLEPGCRRSRWQGSERKINVRTCSRTAGFPLSVALLVANISTGVNLAHGEEGG